MTGFNSACFTGVGAPVARSPLSGAGGKTDLRLFPLPRKIEGLIQPFLPVFAGDSLGSSSLATRSAKGLFFQPRQNIQRPSVQGFGGALAFSFIVHCVLKSFVAEREESTHEIQQVGNHFREDGKNFQGEQNERVS